MFTCFMQPHILFLRVISCEERLFLKYEKCSSFPSHSADEATEGQRGEDTQPKVTQYIRDTPGLESRSLVSQVHHPTLRDKYKKEIGRGLDGYKWSHWSGHSSADENIGLGDRPGSKS